jgi:hypothetical protein
LPHQRPWLTLLSATGGGYRFVPTPDDEGGANVK